jgi:hypothetical protein
VLSVRLVVTLRPSLLIIDYGQSIPAVESSAIRAALADRDRICELSDALQTDPMPYVGDAFDEVGVDHETFRPTHHVLCGAEAREAARNDLQSMQGDTVECGRFGGSDPMEVGTAIDGA